MEEIGWILLGGILAWAGLQMADRRSRARPRQAEPVDEHSAPARAGATHDHSTAGIRSNLLLALENVPEKGARAESAELERAIAASTELTLQLLHLRHGLFPAIGAAPSAAGGDATTTPDAHGTETILVVDDEAAVRSLARRTLERLGYTVLEAADPLEALALLEKSGNVVDLLVTDVMMPHMSGVQLVQRIRDRWPLVRVLYISGVAQPDVERQGLAFLPKPFSPKQLTEAVRARIDALPDPADATPPPPIPEPPSNRG